METHWNAVLQVLEGHEDALFAEIENRKMGCFSVSTEPSSRHIYVYRCRVGAPPDLGGTLEHQTNINDTCHLSCLYHKTLEKTSH